MIPPANYEIVLYLIVFHYKYIQSNETIISYVVFTRKIFKQLVVTHILPLVFVNMSKDIICTCMIPPANYNIVLYFIVFFNSLLMSNMYS